MRKHTSRELQALKTRRNIYNAAIELFNKFGFENTSIEDIARKTGMSVGSFYNYFPTKADIYHEFFIKIDEYYMDTVEPQLIEEDFYDNVILFFKHFAVYNLKIGVDTVRHLYSTQNVYFTSNDRYMYKLLTEILKRGEANNQLTKDMQVNEIADFLRIFARGIIFDWLVYEESYDLEDKMVNSISHLRRNFVKHNKCRQGPASLRRYLF